MSRPNTPTAARVENVRVRYRNGAIGVEDVSFDLHEGEIVSILGPNGAGKTTSSRAIIGFLRSEGAKVTSGHVYLDGREITNFEPHRTVAAGVAYVPERRKIFGNLTVAENLEALRPRLSGRRQRARAEERVYSLFPILKGRARDLAGRLSGGQQQMLALARSMLLEPRVLIVDEMTLGLHPSLHAGLFEAVCEIARGGTSVLLLEESAELALEYSHQVYALRAGRNYDDGPPQKFIGNELLALGYVDG